MPLIILQDGPTRFQPAPTALTTSTLTSPNRLQVSDSSGVLAMLTVGSKTVAMRGQPRTFIEQKKPFADTFARTYSNGLGQSPGGGTWLNLTGTDANFSVNGSQGVVLVDVANTARYASINDGNISDVSATCTLTFDEAPTGAACSASLTFGYQDSSNHYRARLLINTTGTVQLALESVAGGTVTTLGALTTVGTGWVANELWHIRAERAGTTIRCRAWKDGTTEPGTWTHSVVDSTYATGRVGLRAIASSGNTNVPFHLLVESFAVESGVWASPPTVTHNTWVRTLAQPFNGTWTTALADQIRAWAADDSPDVLTYAMMFGAHAPPVIDPATGWQVYGQAGYGPLNADGTRIEFSDFNDYFGVSWDFPSGEHRDFPHGLVGEPQNLDCSGFVRMVYGFRMGIPMTFDLNFDGTNLPRRTRDIGPSGPGIIVAQGTGAPPALTSIQIGDVVLFDADASEPVEGQIDHNGIYIGQDTGGNYRFISSRKVADGPTFADLGGASILNGAGTYATRLRIIRRF